MIFVVSKNVFPDPEWWCLGMLSASVTVNEWMVGGLFLNLARSKDGEPRNKCVWGGCSHMPRDICGSWRTTLGSWLSLSTFL